MRKIVIDIYGADAGPDVIVNGVAKALQIDANLHPVLVGDGKIIEGIMCQNNIGADRYSVIHTDKFVSNNDPATCVFGGGDDFSMVMALKYLKESHDCEGMLSAGNTGALLVGTICHLGLVKGLKCPALAAHIKRIDEKLTCLVDCGANIECTANDLVKFALMGNAFAKCMFSIDSPRIGLLSVGREDCKGTPTTLEAFNIIKNSPNLNFVGNIEGCDIMNGYCDVIVTDGFAGNIVLKNTEATGKASVSIIKNMLEEFTDDAEKAIAKKIQDILIAKFDFNSQGGATFLGTNKTVIKMHGCANCDTVVSCIHQLIMLEDAGFSKLIEKSLL